MVAVEISASELRRIERDSPSLLQLITQNCISHILPGNSQAECEAKVDIKRFRDEVFVIAETNHADYVRFDYAPTIRFFRDSDGRLESMVYPVKYWLYSKR